MRRHYYPVELQEESFQARIVGPDGAHRTFTINRRICPLTSASVRITPNRPLDPGIGAQAPDLSQPAAATANCPFCEPRVQAETPTFPLESYPSGHLRVGDSRLFPNLAPYGRHSAVLTFSDKHHIPLGSFTERMYQDALSNLAQYVELTLTADPQATRLAITQNILPSSGGALFHPHMQVNLDPEPMGYHAAILRTHRNWQQQSSDAHSLLTCFARQERTSPRFVGLAGPWTLLSAFAPTAQEEFQFIHGSEDPDEWASVESWDLVSLARLITGVQGFWAKRGFNSAHVVLFQSLSGEHPPFGRLLLRATYSPWYRNDQSCYEVGCWEPSRDVSPEQLAQMARESLSY